MSQFRKDPFGPTWVIISPERGLEASDFGSAEGAARCPLCPGSEGSLGSEIRALRPSGSAIDSPGWRARVVRPAGGFSERAFEPKGSPLFAYAPSSGYQELIVEHPDHDMRLSEMPREHLTELLKLYRDRLGHLSRKPGIRHVQLSHSVGSAAGALFEHPHALVLALPVANRQLDEECGAAKSHLEAHGRCLFCEVIGAELKGKARLVSYNDAFVALAPYASKTPFETWILPREHGSSFVGVASNALPLFGELLQSVLKAMNTALSDPPYNMILHTLPQSGDEGYHWQMKILPRLSAQTGLDWGSGFFVNPTPPEDAARFLREALALQGVVL